MADRQELETPAFSSGQCTGDPMAPELPRACLKAGRSPRPGGQGQIREVAPAVGGPVLQPPPCAPSLCILLGPQGGPSDSSLSSLAPVLEPSDRGSMGAAWVTWRL